ncbi:MAG: alkaline phosphatase D family protein [Bacteroidota bacterium]
MKIIPTICFFVACAFLPLLSSAQPVATPLLQSGPMLGYSDMRESMIWVQTTSEADVYAVYTDLLNPGVTRHTNTVRTNKEEAFTARLIADAVEPGVRYSYKLYINNKLVALPYPTEFRTPPIWRWRADPPDFTMLTGSCAYINQPEYDRAGKPYGSDYKIFPHMAEQKADLMLWLGDNLYLREPDWNSWAGIVKRYNHTRSLPELQEFFASTQNYAIWDDHDFGPNNSNKSFCNKNQTWDAFRLFWGNPSYGTGDIKGAITSFQWGDADFFLLDNRWYRDADEISKEDKTMIGAKQLDWFLENLAFSKATFKIVAIGGQFLSDAAIEELYSANGFNAERERIIRFIQDNNIKNVIFLTGDVHFTEMSVLKKEGKPSIYDCTFSALTSGSNTSGASWKNTYRVPGTVVMEHNFGKLKFSGPAKSRKLTISCINADNRQLWEQIVSPE